MLLSWRGGGALPWLIPVSSYAFFSLDVSLRALGSPESLRRVRAIECRSGVSLPKYFAGPIFYYSFFRGSISITELSLRQPAYNDLRFWYTVGLLYSIKITVIAQVSKCAVTVNCLRLCYLVASPFLNLHLQLR